MQFVSAQCLLERYPEVVSLLDQSLVSFDFVNEHLCQLLVFRELSMDLVNVNFEIGDFFTVEISLKLVSVFHGADVSLIIDCYRRLWSAIRDQRLHSLLSSIWTYPLTFKAATWHLLVRQR